MRGANGVFPYKGAALDAPDLCCSRIPRRVIRLDPEDSLNGKTYNPTHAGLYMPKVNVYIRNENAELWSSIPEGTRSDWINNILAEGRTGALGRALLKLPTLEVQRSPEHKDLVVIRNRLVKQQAELLRLQERLDQVIGGLY